MTKLFYVNAVINLAVLWQCMCTLNTMKKQGTTPAVKILKFLYSALGTAAMFNIIGPLYGYVEPQPAEVVLTLSFLCISIIKHFNRREAYDHDEDSFNSRA